jgi:hypothetical protein
MTPHFVTAAMTPWEMIHEPINDLLFPCFASGLLVRFNNLEVGTLRAAVDRYADPD